jgi:glycosyltransferase involved in cell wall biosynthesis
VIRKILIISPEFPPSKGIGGRRWAKFAKYLNRLDIDVRVISINSKKQNVSSWDKDIEEIEDKVVRISSNYPEVLTLRDLNIWQKVKYRIELLLIKIKDKGFVFDRTICWKKNLLVEVQKWVDQGYNNILVTCGPFRAAYFLIDIKERNPHINFIVDFRDPWTSNKTSFGFDNLSSRRLQFELSCEKKVIKAADKVIVVSDGFVPYWKSIVPNLNTNKITVISNGYDKEDFEILEDNGLPVNILNDKISFVFTGNLYDKSLHVFKEFCETLELLKKDDIGLFNRLTFDFYGAVPSEFKNITQSIPSIKHHGTVELSSVFRKINEADFMMLFLTDDLNYSFSTKFYEYISQKKPIIVFSKQGFTGEFIEKNELGYHCFSENMYCKIKHIISNFDKGTSLNPKIDIHEYDVKELSNRIVKEVLI